MDDGLHWWVVNSESGVDVPNRKLGFSNEKIAEHVTTLGLWLTDDIIYDFQCLKYTFKWRSAHFSHSYKVWGNSIGIESSKNPGFGISTCLPFSWLWGISMWFLNTTRPRLWVPAKASLFKSSCCNFNKNSVFHTINQGQRRSILYPPPQILVGLHIDSI